MSKNKGVHVVGPDHQQPILKASASDIKVMLDIIEHNIIPITEKSVKDDGNKVFGAAILNSDLSLSVCSTNSEVECPLFHGEVKCIYDWSKLIPSWERGTVAVDWRHHRPIPIFTTGHRHRERIHHVRRRIVLEAGWSGR